jgi:hypothetical protein
VVNDLVKPTYDYICESSANPFQIQNYNREQLDDFAKKNNLAIEEDKEERCLVISKH